jgi:two-component system, OmpR family, sensor histidine kinase VicK
MRNNDRTQELQWEVDTLLDFIENASIPLHSVNRSGVIVWANKAELELLGYTKEEYLGRHISNFHADEKQVSDILDRLIHGETLKDYPARLKCKSGMIKFVLINSSVFRRGNEFIHTRCFTRDITDLRQSEIQKVDALVDLQKKNRSLRTEILRLRKELKRAGRSFTR